MYITATAEEEAQAAAITADAWAHRISTAAAATAHAATPNVAASAASAAIHGVTTAAAAFDRPAHLQPQPQQPQHAQPRLRRIMTLIPAPTPGDGSGAAFKRPTFDVSDSAEVGACGTFSGAVNSHSDLLPLPMLTPTARGTASFTT